MVLREKVYQVIKDRIINGQYQPGQPLNEKEITEELQVSRTPFREAINALNEENLVQIFANRGIFVREITAKDLANSFEIRFLLEPYVTRIACLRMPDSVIRNLVERCQNCLATGYRDMLEEDEYYHQAEGIETRMGGCLLPVYGTDGIKRGEICPGGHIPEEWPEGMYITPFGKMIKK